MVLGWLAGAALMVAVPVMGGLPPPISWIGLGPTFVVSVILLAVLVLLLYLFASLATANGQPSTLNPFGEFCLGALIGVNAGANFMLAFTAMAFIFWPLGLAAAPIVATVLSVINALAAFQGLAGSPVFAAILGWFSWAMPMSWPATLVGVLFFVINAISFALGAPLRVGFEWWTGTVVVHGGVTYINRTGFNLGNFSFFHPDFGNTAPWFTRDVTPPAPNPGTVQGLTFHETGHTLNVAACGSIFHYIGALDQNFLTGSLAFTEQLAEGHLHDAFGAWINWWRPLATPAGGATALGGATVNVLPTSGNANLVEPVTAVAIGTTVTFDRTDTAIVPSPPTDADAYPQGVVNPGVIPSVGFLWELVTRPAGSAATMAPPNAAVSSFTPDVGGDYLVRLHYSDGVNGTTAIASGGAFSPPPGFTPPPPSPRFDSNTIFVVEARTTAQLSTPAGVPVQLSSAGSTGGTTGAAFDWAVTLTVAGATTVIDDPTGPSPTFQADLPGEYEVTLTLTVDTGTDSASHSATCRITVT